MSAMRRPTLGPFLSSSYRPPGASPSPGLGGPGAAGSSRGRPRVTLLQLLLLLCVTTLCGMLWLGHGHSWPGLHMPHSATHRALPYPHAGGTSGGAAAAPAGTQRTHKLVSKATGELEFPLWWHAPYIAQSGLGTEALSIIEALISTGQMQAEDIYITHSGDTFDQAVLKAMSPATRNLLARRQHPQQVADEWIGNLFPSQKQVQLQRLSDWKDARRAIAVCHNWFDCWRRPGELPSNMPGCPCPLSVKRTAFTVARTMFETNGLPEHLAEHVKAMDEVWVPTTFNRDSFAVAGVDPAKIRIVPEGIDTQFWDPQRFRPVNISKLALKQATGPVAPPYGLAKDSGPFPPGHSNATAGAGSRPVKPYVFLSVFKWEARKGWKDLVRGFCEAFKPSDPVVLWILARPFLESGTDFDAKVRAYAAKRYGLDDATAAGTGATAAKLPRIYTSSVHLSEADFVAVYRAVDALVVPTHGEGWGRPQIEAMAMELPVITTNWSGPVAFINEQVAYPLAIEGLSVIKADPTDPSFVQAFVGQKWAQPSVPHLVALLRRVYEHPREAAAKGRAARRHIVANFTPAVVARVVAGEVKRLQGVIRQREQQQREQQQRQQRGGGGGGGWGAALGKKGLFSKLGSVGGRPAAGAAGVL